MRRRLVTVLLAVVTAILVTPAVAVADTQGGETLNGQIRKPETVAGIDITVFQGDEEIGTATTDSEGRWEVALPGPGNYRVVLDEESVPDEFVVADQPGAEHADVNVRPGQQRTVIFVLAYADEASTEPSPSQSSDDADDGAGAAASDTEDGLAAPGVSSNASFGTKAIQLTVAGLLYGLIIAISAVGLSLIFGTTKLTNFAHGDMVTFGALMALLVSGMTLFAGLHTAVTNLLADVWLLGPVLGFVTRPMVLGTVVAVLLGAALGAFLERFIWRPLRKRNVALIQMFIVSIGLAMVLRHVLMVAFGSNRMSYPDFQLQAMLRLGPIAITPRDLVLMILSVLVLVGVAALLQFTRVGKAMRAVSDNRDLAESSGINVDRVTLYVWTLGGALTALGGVFYGLNQIVHWQMGFHLLLLMFAAVILGGLGTAYGAMVGGLIIGLVAQLATLWFPSQLMNAWALGLMIIMLLVRPQGILGRRERVG